MPTPTTHLEIMMMQEAFKQHLHTWQNSLDTYFSRELFPLIMKRIFLQRPYTDDMRQMLDDMGIDWPEHQPISYDGLTFKWQ